MGGNRGEREEREGKVSTFIRPFALSLFLVLAAVILRDARPARDILDIKHKKYTHVPLQLSTQTMLYLKSKLNASLKSKVKLSKIK